MKMGIKFNMSMNTKKLIFITVSMIFAMFMLATIPWFEKEMQKIEQINRAHTAKISKIKKFSEISSWLNKTVKQSMLDNQVDAEKAEHNLVFFYDKYADLYNFRLNKYIINDTISKSLSIYYTLKRDNQRIVKSFIYLDYGDGFLKFQNFHINSREINGNFLLIQPFYGEKNASR